MVADPQDGEWVAASLQPPPSSALGSRRVKRPFCLSAGRHSVVALSHLKRNEIATQTQHWQGIAKMYITQFHALLALIVVPSSDLTRHKHTYRQKCVNRFTSSLTINTIMEFVWVCVVCFLYHMITITCIRLFCTTMFFDGNSGTCV